MGSSQDGEQGNVEEDRCYSIGRAEEIFSSLAVPGVSSNNDFIRINPAPNTKQAYLEKVSSMLDVNVFIEQATYYINNGFKSKPPQLQTFGKSA